MCWSVKNNSLKCARVIVLCVALQVIESLYALWFIWSVSRHPMQLLYKRWFTCTFGDNNICEVQSNFFAGCTLLSTIIFNQDLRI